MYQSEARPKIVTKNLDDIIKQSTFSTKRNSIDDVVRCQRHMKTEPRYKISTEKGQRCNTTVNLHQNDFKEAQLKNNLSMSKHSLESKQKINFLDLSKVEIKTSLNHAANNKNKINNSKYKVSNNENFYTSNNSIVNNGQNIVKNKTEVNHQMQSLYFNQVDAIFTEMQDFLRQTRQRVLMKVDEENQTNGSASNEMVDEMDELFIVFKQEVERLVKRYSQVQTNSQVLKPNNRMQKSRKLIRYNQDFQLSGKQKISVNDFNKQNKTSVSKKEMMTKKSKHNAFNEDEMKKFESFIQERQNTIHSTIVSDSQEDHQFSQLPTQTDAQLLSILVLKNKLNNTKRKYQNSNYNSIQNYILNQKSGRAIKQSSQGEYSFRNKHLFDSTNQSLNKNNLPVDKKKNQKKSTSQSHNKQNREKSVYEIVLEENKRLKTLTNK